LILKIQLIHSESGHVAIHFYGVLMNKPSLGNLKAVELRTIWPDEAADFTPWLADPENIRRLGEAIGFELEVENTEVSVGPFAADILARDLATDNYVVIENQLNRTDHDHLGKSLTYAASLGAKTVVWVAPLFTDEHRKTLAWLNNNSIDDLSFFGVQVELWVIDQSKPAIRLNVVSRPTKIVRPPPDLTPTKRLQLEWWTAFRDALLEAKVLPSAQSPRAQYWYNVALGRAGYHLSATANVDACLLGVRVYMMSRYGAAGALNQLLENRVEIEQGMGEPLLWNPNPEASDKVILLQRMGDLRIREQWPSYLRWMVDAVVRLRKVFGPRIKALELEPIDSEASPPEAGELPTSSAPSPCGASPCTAPSRQVCTALNLRNNRHHLLAPVRFRTG
jgi:hypothetical protein